MCPYLFLRALNILEMPVLQYSVKCNLLKFFMVMNASLPCIMWHCYLTVSVVCIEMVNCNVELYSVYV